MPRTRWTSPGAAFAALLCFAPALTAQSETTVATDEVEDSFFNPCTEETVDRTYTRHITRRKSGNDYVLLVNWSNGKGTGRDSGDAYTMDWKYQQKSQQSAGSERGTYSYRVTTTVRSRGAGSDYTSDIEVKLRHDADGNLVYEESDATGIECS